MLDSTDAFNLPLSDDNDLLPIVKPKEEITTDPSDVDSRLKPDIKPATHELSDPGTPEPEELSISMDAKTIIEISKKQG